MASIPTMAPTRYIATPFPPGVAKKVMMFAKVSRFWKRQQVCAFLEKNGHPFRGIRRDCSALAIVFILGFPINREICDATSKYLVEGLKYCKKLCEERLGVKAFKAANAMEALLVADFSDAAEQRLKVEYVQDAEMFDGLSEDEDLAFPVAQAPTSKAMIVKLRADINEFHTAASALIALGTRIKGKEAELRSVLDDEERQQVPEEDD
ncbi:uncharacterized protein GGS22DRAFT_81678 [Annulohypoxylon maeteangense]|uniref:uncharacterized protein n=1 Tax=Annulohypoxylon maeteangense TaxID=1927788 RepID=UPI0020074E71|nr:uncharacterized protein GGS22DRAFT_81678 [Annulohypoxylon maeteangense]KAI0880667.1 hypothetical protein GGS22DRAFT_81678 [Annulohypoxylon maeteangense]